MVIEISDRAAIEFAMGFYAALGAGKAYEEAFPFGSNPIQPKSLPEGLTPILKVNPNLIALRPTIGPDLPIWRTGLMAAIPSNCEPKTGLL